MFHEGVNSVYSGSEPLYFQSLKSSYGTTDASQRSTAHTLPNQNSQRSAAQDSFERVSQDLAQSPSVNPLDKLSEEEQKQLQELKKRDTEVRAHEQAHNAAGGALTGPPQFKTETGPDGRQYAVEGHVDVETSEGNTPEETIQKAQTIQKAALAPANPSQQDRKVAQEAAQMEAEARAELAREQQEDLSQTVSDATASELSQNPHDSTLPTITPSHLQAFEINQGDQHSDIRHNTSFFA